MRVRKAVIPAAGLGTRFLPATKAIPKEMIPIIDKPMIQYIVEECVESGIEEIVLVTARGKGAILDHFDTSFEVEETLRAKGKNELYQAARKVSDMVNVISVRQKEPLGLGHAILCAQQVVGREPFAVLLGDDIMVSETPAIGQAMELASRLQANVIAVMEVARQDVSKYGIVAGQLLDHQLIRVSDLVEKPAVEKAPSRWALPGRYVLSHRIFDLLRDQSPGALGEIQLTDALSKLAQSEPFYAFIFDGRRYDTGDKVGLIEATVAFGLKRPELREATLQILKDYAKLEKLL